MDVITLAILISGGIVLLGTGFAWLVLEIIDLIMQYFDK